MLCASKRKINFLRNLAVWETPFIRVIYRAGIVARAALYFLGGGGIILQNTNFERISA